MKQLFDINTLNNAKSRDFLNIECLSCGQPFQKMVKIIRETLRGNPSNSCDFCSTKCSGQFKSKLNTKTVNCKQCHKQIKRRNSELKNNNVFCSHSCSCKYGNNHKTKGFRRSKLEIWLENKLKTIYPNLKIIYNNRKQINAELDIYIPSLKLAFELNGPFHYEPIYGQERLDKTKNNDQRKFQACIENNISLCIIDTSKQRYFKEKTSLQFLEIIQNIINKKLAGG